MEWFRERVRQLDVAVRPPEPILKGRDLIALGVAPGPEVGRVLRAVYERQLDGAVTTLEEARAEARRILGTRLDTVLTVTARGRRAWTRASAVRGRALLRMDGRKRARRARAEYGLYDLQAQALALGRPGAARPAESATVRAERPLLHGQERLRARGRCLRCTGAATTSTSGSRRSCSPSCRGGCSASGPCPRRRPSSRSAPAIWSCSSLLLLRLLDRHAPDVPGARRTVLLVVLGLSNVVPFILRGPNVHEVAVASGACWPAARPGSSSPPATPGAGLAWASAACSSASPWVHGPTCSC